MLSTLKNRGQGGEVEGGKGMGCAVVVFLSLKTF